MLTSGPVLYEILQKLYLLLTKALSLGTYPYTVRVAVWFLRYVGDIVWVVTFDQRLTQMDGLLAASRPALQPLYTQ